MSRQRGRDLDGNLTQDGKWSYSWDAENRLVAIESTSATPAANKRKFEFASDADGHRVRTKAYNWNTGTSQYDLSSERKFIYDGWLCLAEADGSLGLVRSYCWGSDLSGSFEGAGGVGGLLWMKDAASATLYNVSYDGNGNVLKLTKASDGTVAASYEYSPFGEVIESSGPYAASNPFRFSTKYQDASGLLYYGYRYLNPDTGRWICRDPLGENGGLNLYGFVMNNSVAAVDFLGLQAVPSPVPGPAPTPEPDSNAKRCKELADMISQLRNEIVQRQQDLRQDSLHLYETRPVGSFSYQGHRDQMAQRQGELRRALNE